MSFHRLEVAGVALLCWMVCSPTFAAQQKPPSAERQAAAEIDAGLRDYQAGRLDQAILRLRQAGKVAPDNPQVRLYLGLFLYEQNKDSLEAQRNMESVLDKFPSNRDLQLRLLDSYLRARNETQSEALVQRLQSAMAEDSRFAFNIIYTLISHGRTASARREIDKVSNNLQGEVLFIGGLIELGSEDSKRALELLEAADGHGFPARDSRQMLTLADSYFRLRAFPQAARAYEAFVAHHADVAPAQRFRLGMSYYGYGDFERALEQLLQVKKAAPETPEIDLYLASILIETKKPEEARPLLDAELKRDPASFKAMAKAAYLEYLAGHDELCRQWLEKSLARNPLWFESQMVSGLLHMRLGQYEDAVKDLEACIRQEPEYPKAYFQLSNAWRRLGNEEKAGQYLERFKRLQDAAVERVKKARGMSDQPRKQ
jgi:tetratricopeptide (TPR) repeat protein